MTMLQDLRWSFRCCADDTPSSQYTEATTKDGGVTRLRRAPTLGGILVCRFDAANRAIDKDDDGVPTYVLMTEDEAQSLLA